MRNVCYLCIGVAVWLLSSCSSSPKDSESDIKVLMNESLKSDGLQRTTETDVSATFTYNGKEYQSRVVCRPDESLPIVVNEQGEKFVDNRITLRITSGGNTIVEKVFTKASFASQVDDKFLKNSILEGMVYSDVTKDGIEYGASVSYPLTDLYIPFLLKVTLDGRVTMTKADFLDE